MKLKFGDQKSIDKRDEAEIENIWTSLKDDIRCPFCRGEAKHYYSYDMNDKSIGIEFDCDDKCVNSLEYGNHELSETWFDFDGKLL